MEAGARRGATLILPAFETAEGLDLDKGIMAAERATKGRWARYPVDVWIRRDLTGLEPDLTEGKSEVSTHAPQPPAHWAGARGD